MTRLRKLCGTILAAACAAFSCSARVVRDIPYDSSIGRFGLGDLFLPETGNGESIPRAKRVAEGDALAGVGTGNGAVPLVLTIHGGGWAHGDRASWEGVSRFFSEQLGFAAFNIEYRLASVSNRWPACGNDCVNAARFVLSDEFKKRFSLSHDKIWICGGSAGGHLALWTLANLPVGDVAGCVSISAIGDPKPDFTAHRGRYNALFGAKIDDASFASMNPVLKIKPGMAPLLCTHAEGDTVVPIASHRAFADAYCAAGNRCKLFAYPCDVQPGLKGHCIWIPGLGPYRRLIPPIENQIRDFVANTGKGLNR